MRDTAVDCVAPERFEIYFKYFVLSIFNVQPVDLSDCPELQPPEPNQAGADNADNPFQK